MRVSIPPSGLEHDLLGFIVVQKQKDSTVCVVRNLERTDNFRFSECSWDGNTCAEINDVNWEPGDMVSDWPAGPYALPMSVDGCPESKWKGWEQGYIDLTWENPYAVLNRNVSTSDDVNDNDTTVDLEDITLAQITDIQSLIKGPYNRYRIKLNFCFKLRNDPILDIGEWPNGSYGIYGDITGCPTGFSVDDKIIKLPKSSFWISDGYLPFFHSERTEDNEGLSGFLAHSTKAQTSIEWTVLDLGKTFPVTAVFVPHEIDMKTFTGVTSMHGQDDKYCLKWTDVVNHAWGDDYTFPDESVRDAGRNCRYPVGPFLASRLFCMTDFNSRELCEGHFAGNNFPCNSDMGMTDLNIEDYDITSSSTLADLLATFARPFLAGWCAEIDDTSPFIMIRLHPTVRLDGLTVWNWEGTSVTVVNGSIQKQFFKMGARAFEISFGLTEDNLTVYSGFQVDLLYHVDEPQHFRFYRPVYARVAKIHTLEPLYQNMRCLRFELHGCRKTGVKNLQCTKSDLETLNRYSGLVMAEIQSTNTLQNTSLEDCERACLHNKECTSVHVSSNGDCLLFKKTDNQLWHLQSKDSVAGHTAAKTCESVIKNERIISSIGYPLHYGHGESYKWVIKYEEYEFIRFVITNVSLNTYEPGADQMQCDDTIIFDEERQVFSTHDWKRFTIDSSYNGRIFVIDSRVYQLTLTFTSCQYYTAASHRGRGFRAIVQKQGSEFILADRFMDSRKYCTLNRPPGIIYTASGSVGVTFSKANALSVESFRLLYRAVKDVYPETITVRASSVPDIIGSMELEARFTQDSSLKFVLEFQEFELLLDVSSCPFIFTCLRRYRDNKGKVYEMWENKTPVTFSAWKKGEPLNGDCTRMGFHLGSEDMTWEATECSKLSKAFYFVCEHDIGNRSIDTESDRCFETHYTYSGVQNSTVSGTVCIRWEMHFSQNNFDQFAFPDKDLVEAGNHCRDPTSSGFQWCYTTYPGKSWEICKADYGKIIHDKHDNSSANVKPTLKCNHGSNEHSYASCNRIVDCDDISDELDCHSQLHPLLKTASFVESTSRVPNVDPGSTFLCGSLEWISSLARCDGIIDCKDVSDETNCSRTTSTEGGCGTNQFTCGNGVCIHVSLVCNFVTDCADSSDEICDFPDCGEDEYTCESGQCIPSYQRCDAFHNCWDGTDENNCQSCSSPAVFNCDFVRCLPWRIVCDGYPDCKDNSDESSCDTSDVTSCKEWWEAGYRETGKYISEYRIKIASIYGGKDASSFSRYSSPIFELGIENCVEYVTLELCEIRFIYFREGNMVFYTRFVEYDNRYVPYDDIFDFLFASTDDTANFTQEIVQSCAPPLDAASEVDDIRYNHAYLYCRCLKITIGIGWEPTINSVRDCGTGGLLTEDERDSILFDYIYTANHRALSWKNSDIPSDSLRLQIGPVVFAEEYFTDASTFGCGEARNVFNMSLLCVYDTDQTGTIIGCRSGSHLQNCKYHECPEGTVKCPDSYCIPLRFVCDGVEQCPNSEDEFQCGCGDTEREVIILHEDSEFRGPDLIKVARQLYSTNGIVRSVKYKSNKISQGIPFKHRILHISDKEIKPFELNDRDYTCEYKVLANDFMNVIQFSRKTSHSLLFIQNSPESAVVASLIFSNITNMPDFTVYRIMEGVNTAKGQFPYVKDVYVENWNVMSTLAARYLPKLCKEATMTHCPGAYKCAYSKMCVQLSEICDGYRHCIHGDDEFLCDFTCPVECVCSGFTVSCGDSGFNVTDVRGFPVWTRSLELTDSAIDIPLSETLFDFPFLYLLNLSSSGTERIEENAFIRLSNLRILDISNNKLTALSENVFAGLQNLHTLNLDGNSEISFLGPFTFKQLVAIRVLRITGTKLRTVMSNTFSGLSLEILDLRDNDIQEIEEFGLGNLEVNHIRFQENDITSFHKGVFTGVLALKSLQTPAYKFCCIRPNYVSEDKCFPQKDEFSSCEDLMRISALQTMLWLIGLCALIGNILSVIYRLIFDRQRLRLGYGIFVTNLAVADFLMGIYLLTIAVADAVFRKRYIFMDDYWRNSSWCTFAGVLSTLSSEASVMFLCLITLDRLLVIKYPFGQVRFDTRKASMISVLAWITSLFIALFPLMLTGYFQNRFYNKSGVCIALPLTRDRPPGWLYSVLVFIGLNFATFLLIAAGQWSIYMEIRKSSSKLRKSQSRKKDLIIARNLLLVVATDFLCWFPIGCMGVMAMSGYVISGDVYAWAAVFILPVNSALNPVLYTLTAIIGKKSFTPNTDEQKRNTTNTGIGKRFLVSQHIMTRRFYLIDSSVYVSYITVQECFQKFDHIPFQAILKMSYQLTECLRVLHKNGLVLRRIDEYSIYVNTNQAKVVGDIQIRHEPTLCIKISEKREDVYSLGLLIKELVVKSFK
ncbi:uncharacterized protein LOC123546331 [Mercenaria mercenaria]|uniref:uncharacterized protein LOC123546331 n=1 Tax=Mercenaria mercenaria TaxID=6596 RepID=UPI00234F4D2E|nr:uncharacterized protein LOC123546331 [Mercenaria mercenaria]